MVDGARARDAALVIHARLGDRDAFRRLAGVHLTDVHDHLSWITGDDASPLTAAVFERVVERLGSLDEPERFRAWLFAIAGDVLRDNARPGHLPDQLDPRQRTAAAVIAELPLDQARAIDLASRRGMTTEEARLALGRSPTRPYRRGEHALTRSGGGLAAYASLPEHVPPPLDEVLRPAMRSWSARPAPAPAPDRHGLVIWGAAAAAVLFGTALPALSGLGPRVDADDAAAVEYSAVPFEEAAGIETPPQEEPDDEVLPPLPQFTTPPPEPQPEPTETAAESPPSPSPTPEPSPTPSPSPTDPGTTPSDEPTCAVPVGALCPSEEPTSSEPPPSEEPTQTPTSSEPATQPSPTP